MKGGKRVRHRADREGCRNWKGGSLYAQRLPDLGSGFQLSNNPGELKGELWVGGFFLFLSTRCGSVKGAGERALRLWTESQYSVRLFNTIHNFTLLKDHR